MIRCLKQIWLLDPTKLTSQDIDTIWKYGSRTILGEQQSRNFGK